MSALQRIALLALFILGSPAFSRPAEKPAQVFQLGLFDGASDDFARGSAARPISFVVGQSDPAKDWPAEQAAAPAEGQGPEAAATRTIQFAIRGPIAPAYKLHLALILESHSVPALRIGINGKYGIFYLQSGLSGHTGHFDDTFESLYSPADVTFSFPRSFLRAGANSITIQVVQEKGKEVSDASVNYDAIALDTETALAGPASSAFIRPTVFYKGDADHLKELVEVYVESDEPGAPADGADLEISGTHYKQAFASRPDFGERKLEFWVPEFHDPAPASLTWQIGGERFHTEEALHPGKKWTLFLVPHIHIDVGYSDYQPKVAAIQTRDMDEAMDMAERHPGFSFSMDGSWALDQFLQTRTESDQQRAIDAMKKGQLFIPAQYANLLTGFPTAETLIRSLYMSANFSREHGTPFNYANITDVPSYSWSYASVLAAAGLPYLVAGPNGHETRAPVLLQGRLNEQSPFWWVGPDGGKVLFWYDRHYWETGILFGIPTEVAAGVNTVPLFLENYERNSYRAHAVIVYGSQPENTDLDLKQAALAGEWNAEFAYPKLEYSGFAAAMKTIASQFGGDFPTISGDGGPYWEDGIASNARFAAKERQIESRAPSVDKLATLTSLINPRLAADKTTLDRMWTNMVLADEHTWNSHDSSSDPSSDETARQSKIKTMYAEDAAQAADYLARNSMSNLAYAVPAARGNLVVFNLLNWKRSELVDFDLEKGRVIFDPATGATVPVEVVEDSAKLTKVRFLAENVPAFGYKVYELRRSKSEPQPAAATQTTTLENRYYRIQLDPASGAVRGIYDKQLNKELVNQQSPYRFGQYLYVSGGDTRPNTLLQYRTIELEPKLTVDAAHSGRLISVTREPYGLVACMKSTDTNTSAVSTEIRLFDNEKKIEFVEDVDKTAVRTREAVYFAFPFAMDHPEFRYEIQNGVVDPAKDMYPGAGHQWFSVQHWVSVEQDGVSGTVIPLDVPLITLGDIYRGAWPSKFGVRPGNIFSFAMNNYWSTNYDASQGGHTQVRYVVTSAAATDAPALSRMGWEEATPLEVDEITAQDKAEPPANDLEAKSASYLEVDDPDLLVEDWKPAEDGNGTILRLLDLGGAARQVTVRTTLLELNRVLQTDAVERDMKELKLIGPHAFEVQVGPHQIITIRLIGKNPNPVAQRD